MVTKESKVTDEDKQLRDYELVVIINPELADDAVDGIIDNVSRLVTQNGGTVDDVERWGKRKLAYPIKHFLEGNYVLARCKMKPASGKELEASLRISEEVLRHLLVRLDS
ncbi:30S ribosomal protein S6 [subsurface metagenome]